MNINQIITIVPSIALEKMKLNELNGHQGKVIEVCHRKDGSVLGVWVELDKPYLNELEWYIPYDSIIQ